MKKLAEVIEVNNEGLIKLLGQYVTVYCQTFIYAGILGGVNDDCILLNDCSIVYDTGSHSKKEFELAEKMPNDWYIMKSKIESFGIFKQKA